MRLFLPWNLWILWLDDNYDIIQLDNASGYWSCDGECQDTSKQCHGKCPEGWVSCGSQNCRSANSSLGDTWECGTSCISKSSQCNTNCPPDSTTLHYSTVQCKTSCPPDHYPCCKTCDTWGPIPVRLLLLIILFWILWLWHLRIHSNWLWLLRQSLLELWRGVSGHQKAVPRRVPGGLGLGGYSELSGGGRGGQDTGV